MYSPLMVLRRKLQVMGTALLMLMFFASPALAKEQQEYSLSDLLAQAMQSNHGVKAQIEELKAKTAAASAARWLTGPYIELSGGYLVQSDPTGLIPAHGRAIPAEYDDNITSYALTARQVLYDAGKTRSLISY